MDVTMSSGFETLAGILLVMLAAAPAVWTIWKRRLLARAARRSARGHLKQGLTVALTASLATAVIAGALVVGDSMDAMVELSATESLPGIDGTLRAVQPVETGYFTRLFIYPDWMGKVKREALLLTAAYGHESLADNFHGASGLPWLPPAPQPEHGHHDRHGHRRSQRPDLGPLLEVGGHGQQRRIHLTRPQVPEN